MINSPDVETSYWNSTGMSSGAMNAEASYFAGQSNSNRRKLVPNSHLPVNQPGSSFPGNNGHRKNSLDNNSPNSYMKWVLMFGCGRG